ncbi:cytochrome P450 [Mycobacterium sp. OTB74]|jgi:cytochrome P450|uniref:cytochrome P450 n=1 Tax=Mycobacterium sp. OTB74 TaxID=1853452 RepID=UPI002476FB04|nr:cytochrome P450 [Mycobacterium sp. OTB74]MDH6244110.1 cytochrome P450 [Mycobacterium sp. OTB74]
MTQALPDVDLASLPPVPVNPMPYLRRVKATRACHTGFEALRDAGGPVTQCVLGPAWLAPPIVLVMSPQGVHDVLGRTDGATDKALPMYDEIDRLLGSNVFSLNMDGWLPRRRALQPLFTKRNVAQFAGHMAEAAGLMAERWTDGTQIDLDAACHALTLRALGRSVFGRDLDERADAVGPAVRVTLKYCADRAWSPVRAPSWLPTPARKRARAASATVHGLAAQILADCRADDSVNAPLVHALIKATDPDTGKPLSDSQICNDLVVFILAGHDTTATTLTYAFWALGHHPEIQERVAAEAAALGNRPLTTDDVKDLPYTVQVLHEALRLCPPGAANPRMVMSDIAIDGYRVPAGTIAVVGVYAMQRDPALWANPTTFDPDRFSPENSQNRDRWQYVPFGAGPRSCIGNHFAMLEATLALATIVRRTEIRSLSDDFPVEVPFTMVADGPIRAHVRPRS